MKSANDPKSQVIDRLDTARRLGVVTHARPDGDGLGSMIALCRAARGAGREAQVCLLDDLPERYVYLFDQESPHRGPAGFCALADDADVLVILDTCAFSQLDGLAEHLRPRRDKALVVDHHATCDDVAAVQWVDTSASATGVLVGELLDALGWTVDLPAAEALTVAVASDTGWLRYANTDGRTLRAVAEWVDAGVRPDLLYRRLYESERRERMMLRVRVLESLELHCGDRLAVMTLRRRDFDETGARMDETENMVNEALRMKCVEEAILLVETPETVRVSLRSRDAIDVSAVARPFGGGGHARAAGLRADEEVDTLKRKLIDACSRVLAEAGFEW